MCHRLLENPSYLPGETASLDKCRSNLTWRAFCWLMSHICQFDLKAYVHKPLWWVVYWIYSLDVYDLLCCILTFTDVYMICVPFDPMQFMQHVMSALICHALICYGVPCSAITYLALLNCAMLHAGNTKGGSIAVPSTSCLTGLESAVWQLTTIVFIWKTD